MTRAERLDDIVRAVNAPASEHLARTGAWPHHQAPYIISTTEDDGRRIRVETVDGDVLSGAGATLEDALVALAAKVR